MQLFLVVLPHCCDDDNGDDYFNYYYCHYHHYYYFDFNFNMTYAVVLHAVTFWVQWVLGSDQWVG